MKTNFIILVVIGAVLAGTPVWASIITWQGGTNWWGNANWDVDGTPNQNHSGGGNTTIIDIGTVWRSGLSIGSDSEWDLSGDGSLIMQPGTPQIWDVWWDDITIADNFTLDVDYILMHNPFTAGNPSTVNLTGGTIVTRDANSFRSDPAFGNIWFSLNGASGSTTITQMDNLTEASTLISKVNTGYFRIDGVRVFGTGPANAVNERYLSISVTGNEQTLTIIPEPSSLSLFGIVGLLLLGCRRTHADRYMKNRQEIR